MAYIAVYQATDLGNMLIDIIGAMFNALAVQAQTLAVILIVGLVAVVAVDALTGVFGIFKFIRHSRK